MVTAEGRPVFSRATVVSCRTEWRWWNENNLPPGLPTRYQPFVETARRATRPYQQRDRIRFFSGTAEVAPGITGMPALGHTAGHSIYRFIDGQTSLLTLGDLVHLPTLQLAQPDVQTRLDMQPDLAASSRRHFLQEAASNREFVIGNHIASHVVARVKTQGKGFALQTV